MTDDHAPPPRTALSTTPARADDDHRNALPVPGGDRDAVDLADYDWIPVRRAPRVDGWSRDKQRLFIATLADTGSVRAAAREARMSTRSAYALRRAPDGTGFAAAWDTAVRRAMDVLLDAVTDRAINGVDEVVYGRDDRVIGHRTRHDNRLAMFLLRAHMPDRFRDAHRPPRAATAASPPVQAPPPVAEALARLDPPTPPMPHLLVDPDELAVRLTVADLVPGELPHWHRDRDLAPDPSPPAPDPVFEALLAKAKRGNDIDHLIALADQDDDDDEGDDEGDDDDGDHEADGDEDPESPF